MVMPVRRTPFAIYLATHLPPGWRYSVPVAPPPRVAPLAELVTDINFHHTEGRTDIRRGVEHFHRCGLLLLKARAEVKRRGQKWSTVRKDLAFNERRAQRYQALAKCDVTSGNLVREWRRICGNAKRRSNAAGEPEIRSGGEDTAGKHPPGPEPKLAPDILDDGKRLVHIGPTTPALADRCERLLGEKLQATGIEDPVELVMKALECFRAEVCRAY